MISWSYCVTRALIHATFRRLAEDITMNSSIWVTLGPIIVINIITLITFVTFLVRRRNIPVPDEMKGRHQSKILGPLFHEYWYWLIKPLANVLVAMRISPNIITFVGFLLSVFAAYLFAMGWFGYAGWVIIAGATCDLFDGIVARVTNTMSRSGAFFDSVMDRFSEGVVFVGLAWYFRESWMLPVVVIGLAGSLFVSYTRARGEGVGVVCKKGLMQRGERLAYLCITSTLQPCADVLFQYLGWSAPAALLVVIGLCAIALFTMITSVYRLIFIMNALDTADQARGAEETVPQMLSSLGSKQGRERALARTKFGYDNAHANSPHCVVFVADGLDCDLVREMTARGDLANLQRYLIEPGVYTEATSVFPAVPSVSSVPLVTGCYPGTCNVPGERWFDRSVPPHKRFTLKRFRDYAGLGAYAIDYDLSKDVKTLFEYSRQAVSLLGSVNRGAGLVRDPGALHPSLHRPNANVKSEEIERAVFEWFSQSLKKQPDFILYHFASIGRAARQYGVDHESVRAAYQRFDQYVGDVVERLKTYGMFDNTALMMVSTHSHAQATTVFDIEAWLMKRYPKLMQTAGGYKQWLDSQAINLLSGQGMANLYLREDRSWSDAYSAEALAEQGLFDALCDEPAVDLVMSRASDGAVIVNSARGRAKIYENGQVLYDVEGSDPFGYGNLPKKMTTQEALQWTYDTTYPDGIMQALQLFRSRRCGDVVVSAKAHVDMAGGAQVCAGALHRTHSVVPCAISLPMTLQHPVRTVDLFPTMMNLVGINQSHVSDGVSLV